MTRLHVALFALLALLAAPAFADPTERLRFVAGAERAMVAARLEGAEGRDFLVAARAGQRITVEMTTTNPSAHFNVWAPGADAAMFIGSTEGARFEGVLPVEGDYRVQTYLMRGAARRDGGYPSLHRTDRRTGCFGPCARERPDLSESRTGLD
jgi:hypothetical protein